MWPALIFAIAVILIVADALWRERRLRRQRLQAKQEYTARLLEQQQQASAHAQAQQRALFDSMADGVVLLDPAGRIQLVNDSLRRLFNLAPGFQGPSLLEAFRLPALAALAERLPAEKTVLGMELELAGPAPRFLEVNASAVRDRDGQYQGAIFVFHDLTRTKQLERTRQEFVANVSHELRTPLSLIKGFVETLLDGAMDEPDRARQFLNTIQKHTDRLTFLIEDLLTISRLESGKVTLNRQRVLVRALADRVREALESKAPAKQVQLKNLVPDDFAACADADHLEQVLLNLVDNAIKYGRDRGVVTINAKEQADGTAEIWVQDDGPGIPYEAQPRIFERFYRVDRARSRETGGTGLGLAIVKHIVLAHGGEVWVESDPGHGARFHFTLPNQR